MVHFSQAGIFHTSSLVYILDSLHNVILIHYNIFCVSAPSIKSIKVQQALSPRSNSSDISDEFVPRSEYNRLVQQFEELLATMNKFRLEISQKISMLEAKIAKQ